MHKNYCTLDEYIKQQHPNKKGEVQRMLAKKMGVSLSSLRHWRTGRRSMTYKHALLLEELTSGKVPCFISRPDIYSHQFAEHNVSKQKGERNQIKDLISNK